MKPSLGFLSGHDFTGCGKTPFFEGYGLQALHNYCVMNPALAAEGGFLLKPSIFAQAL
jgi:hypothetical protein